MRLLALISVLVTLSLPALANHTFVPKTCFDHAIVIGRVLRTSPGSEVRYDLVGDDAHAFLLGFNALPPASDYTGDEVLVFTMPKQSTNYWMVLLKDGCATHRGRLQSRRLSD
jgi:hypothetical protein